MWHRQTSLGNVTIRHCTDTVPAWEGTEAHVSQSPQNTQSEVFLLGEAVVAFQVLTHWNPDFPGTCLPSLTRTIKSECPERASAIQGYRGQQSCLQRHGPELWFIYFRPSISLFTVGLAQSRLLTITPHLGWDLALVNPATSWTMQLSLYLGTFPLSYVSDEAISTVFRDLSFHRLSNFLSFFFFFFFGYFLLYIFSELLMAFCVSL